jgi:hypothetical protein
MWDVRGGWIVGGGWGSVIQGSFVCQVDGAAAPQDLAGLRPQQRYRDTLYSLLKSKQRAAVSAGDGVSWKCAYGR